MRAIAGYELLDELGRGGMGVVHRARDPRLGREVAIKLLPAARCSATARERFRREGETLARLEHPQIVKVHALGEEAGQLYLVMDLVPGESLQRRLEQRGPLAPTAAAELVRKLALAVAAAHREQVIHRDLKPANVLIDPSGEPRLLDFGLAKALDSTAADLSKSGQSLGTPGYWAPEQAVGDRREIGPTTDVYGLGGLLYACLTGSPPIDAGSYHELVIATQERLPEPPSRRVPGVPAELDAICLRALAKAPADRYETAGALAEDLRRVLSGATTEVVRDRDRRRAGLVAGGLIAGGLIAAVGVVVAARPAAVAPPTAAPAVPRLIVETPRDGELVFERTLTLTGRLESAGTCEVRVGGQRRRVRADEDFRLSVSLEPGDNALVVEAVDAAGVAAEPQRLTVRHHPAPDWFQALPAERRPQLPLPAGLAFKGSDGEYVNEVDGAVLVYVPPGRFWMGEDREGSEWDRSAPRHQVTLTRGYFAGKYEVSWGQYRAFCAATGHAPPSRPPFEGTDETHPVLGVGWVDAQAYCRWAGLRLLTEAEWEYAARGSDGRDFPWGDAPPTPARTHCNLSMDIRGQESTVPVYALPDGASPFGCLNMLGNATEWVQDALQRYPGPEPRTDPLVDDDQGGRIERVVRDPGYAAPPSMLAVYYRVSDRAAVPEVKNLGFRVGRSAGD